MRTAAKVLKFPLSGIARDIAYREATTPDERDSFATPFAVNVRGSGSFHNRLRGGSRPGLTKVDGTVETSDTSRWLWPNGEEITWPDGANIAFTERSSVIIAPDGSKIVDPHAKVNAPGLGIEPDVTAFYRNRVVAAKDAQWYMSGIGDAADWDFGKDSQDSSRAVSGNVELAGVKGETITALMPVRDSLLYVSTAHSLWCISGDPTDGSIKCVSESVGCVSANAWCYDGARLWLVSNQGVYAVEVGGYPQKVSTRLPEEFRGVTSALLIYDCDDVAVHMFTDQGDWWYDIGSRAFWRMSFRDEHRPNAACYAMLGGVGVCVFLGKDGEWRMFDNSKDTDDGEEIASKVLIGPIRVSQRDDMDGMVGEVMATMAEGSADVDLGISTAHSPERSVQLAEDGDDSYPHKTISQGWNNTWRPRHRGAWATFTISSTGRWAYESITAVMKMTGRLR